MEQIKCYCGHTTYCDCGPLPKQTAVEQLIERIQLEYDAAEKEYLENKSRESYIALRCFQLCRTFAKEAIEIEAKQRQEDTNHGYSQGYDDGAEGVEPMKPEIQDA